MRRFLLILGSLGFLIFGGWLLANMDKIRNPGDFLKVLGHQISELGGGALPQNTPWRASTEHVIRIGSFNANGFDDNKMKDAKTVSVMADIIRQFDVVALQEFDSSSPFALKRFVKQLNASGRDFEILRGASQVGMTDQQQAAILYDASTIELESSQYYHINDPDNVLARDPLVAWFRTRANENAFTFTLVNVHLTSQGEKPEVSQINQIFRAVRNDGRGEDDVILAGDFGISGIQLNELAVSQGLQAVNVDVPTDTSSTSQLDNFLLDPLATSEFTGDSGVFDFLKLFNFTLEQAMFVSDHMPVWAEFEVFEHDSADRFANTENKSQR